jgi:predicted DNA-binding transcriptional regulator AlpA
MSLTIDPADYMAPEELARFSGLSLSTLKKYRVERRGPAFLRIGRRVTYARQDVVAWLESCRKEAGRDAVREARKEVVAPILAARSGGAAKHRFGRHGTKQEFGRAD